MEPSLIMQAGTVALMRGSAALVALVGDRIYDTVPLDAAFPFVSIGPSQSTPDDADCITNSEVFLQIDVWSRAVGFQECKTVSAEIIKALHRIETTYSAYTFEIENRFANYQRNPDGLTNHGVLSFRAEIET